MTPRCTKAARIRRVDIVYRMLLLGLDTPQIVEQIGRKYASWGVRQRAIESYVHDARQLLIEGGEYERAVERGRAIGRLNDIYARCIRDGDLHGAIQVVKVTVELFGLNEQVKVDVANMRQQLVDLLLEDVMDEADEITRGAAKSD